MTKIQAQTSIEVALARVNDILAGKDKVPDVSAVQISLLKSNLDAMLQNLIGCINLPLPLGANGMGHIIVDSWPFGTAAGDAIISAEAEYWKYLKSSPNARS